MMTKNFFILILISFKITIVFGNNENLNSRNTKTDFNIFVTSPYTSDLRLIGNAQFEGKYLDYNSKKVIYYTVDLNFENSGVMKKEKYESVVEEGSLNHIYSRFKDPQKGHISYFKKGEKLQVSTFLMNGNSTTRKLSVKQSFFPATLLYLKLAGIIGEKNSLEYWALEEDSFMAHNFIAKGRAIYQGFNEVTVHDKNIKLHMFLNSFSSEKSQIYFDEKRNLYAIKLFKGGQSIIFLRNM